MAEDTTPPYRRLRDPRELNALAHPVRVGIIELLSVSGPLTATELAERLEETPANCSWHLRKLAEHGFVEEAEGGKGRRRPWRVPSVGFTWSDEDATPEERRAGEALSQVALQRQVDRWHEARSRLPDEPPEWRAATDASQFVSWLTAAELQELNTEVRGVLERYHARLTDPALRPPGSRLCELVAWGTPVFLPGVEPTGEAER
jgi:DNA-binding transcriptional ArsR family regulator